MFLPLKEGGGGEGVEFRKFTTIRQKILRQISLSFVTFSLVLFRLVRKYLINRTICEVGGAVSPHSVFSAGPTYAF